MNTDKLKAAFIIVSKSYSIIKSLKLIKIFATILLNRSVFFVCFNLFTTFILSFSLWQNPGFDFSKADISGNYSGGGPQFPS